MTLRQLRLLRHQHREFRQHRCLCLQQKRRLLLRQDKYFLLRQDRCLPLRQDRSLLLRQDTCLLLKRDRCKIVRQGLPVGICLLSAENIRRLSTEDICPVSIADICPPSTEDARPVSTQQTSAASEAALRSWRGPGHKLTETIEFFYIGARNSLFRSRRAKVNVHKYRFLRQLLAFELRAITPSPLHRSPEKPSEPLTVVQALFGNCAAT